MAEQVIEIIQYVLRDVTRNGLRAPTIDAVSWDEDPHVSSVMIYSGEDSTGQGVSVKCDIPREEQVVAVADQIQEWVIEQVGANRSNWPPCPNHPNNHPLAAVLSGDQGVWACPSSKEVVAKIGELVVN